MGSSGDELWGLGTWTSGKRALPVWSYLTSRGMREQAQEGGRGSGMQALPGNVCRLLILSLA